MRSERFNNYLNEISQRELLTAEEEIELGTIIQRHSPAIAAAEKAAEAAADLAAKDAVLAGIESAVRESSAAIRKLVEHNLRLVVKIAVDHQHATALSIEELTFEGNRGLIRAAELFNPTLGNRFSTYATWWVIQFVRTAINKALTVRIPIRRAIQISRIQRAQSYSSGTEQNIGQLAAETKLSERDVEACLASCVQIMSLDASIMEDGADGIEGILPCEDTDPAEHAMQADDLRFVNDVIDELDPKEQDVIRGHFGINRPKETLQALATRHRISAERVRQIQKEALAKLRQYLHEQQAVFA